VQSAAANGLGTPGHVGPLPAEQASGFLPTYYIVGQTYDIV
jgi:hypothetical protein